MENFNWRYRGPTGYCEGGRDFRLFGTYRPWASWDNRLWEDLNDEYLGKIRNWKKKIHTHNENCYKFKTAVLIWKSIIPTTCSYDTNQKILTKGLLSKSQLLPVLHFTGLASLCVFHHPHRVLCWIIFIDKMLSIYFLSFHRKLFHPYSYEISEYACKMSGYSDVGLEKMCVFPCKLDKISLSQAIFPPMWLCGMVSLMYLFIFFPVVLRYLFVSMTELSQI